MKNNIINFIKLRNKLSKKFPLVRVSLIELEDNKDEIKYFENFWTERDDGIHF